MRHTSTSRPLPLEHVPGTKPFYDEPLFSPRRMALGAAWWIWYTCQKGPHTIPFWRMVWTYHRPHYQHEKGIY